MTKKLVPIDVEEKRTVYELDLIEIDYSKYKFIGRTESDLYCFRKEDNPLKVIPMNKEFYIEWRKQQGILPVIDAEGKYFALEMDLAGIQKAVQRILDGHSREGQKELAEIMQRIRGRRV